LGKGWLPPTNTASLSAAPRAASHEKLSSAGRPALSGAFSRSKQERADEGDGRPDS